jgi:hypothetical protein
MAACDVDGDADLPRDRVISSQRDLRIDESASPSGRVGAEQYCRRQRASLEKEYAQFLFRARGWLLEVETQLEIVCNLEYIAPDAYGALKEQTTAVARVLNGLIAAIEHQIDADGR